MNKVVAIALLVITSTLVDAQPQNANWFLGFGENNGRILKWINNELAIVDSTQIGTKWSSSIVSDKNGNLLFYTNGCKVFNRLHEPILNGGDIPCLQSNYAAPGSDNKLAAGSDLYNTAVIVNDPSDSNRYCVFATDTWTASGPGELFYYNVVDMTLDSGLGGFMPPFNRVLDSVRWDAISGKVTAIRHANGRDWWILNPMADVLLANPNQPASAYLNGFYIKRYLLTPQGIGDTASQYYCHAATDGNHRYGEIAVNKEGNKIALANWNRSVLIMDFDRCAGLTSNCTVIDTLQSVDIFDNKYFANVEFSSNSQVLYAGTGSKLYQYNLNDINPASTRYLIDSHNTNSEATDPTAKQFGQLQMGQDGKIYTSLSKLQYWNNNSADTPYLWLRRIEHPDSLGAACQLNNHALYLGVMTIGLPNLVNWNLGALEGSECDTLTSIPTAIRHPEKITAQLFPNPATSEATLVLNKPAPEQMQLVLYDVVGKEAMKTEVNKNEKYVHVNLSGLSAGVYFYRLLSHQAVVVQNKMIIMNSEQ